MQDTSELRRAIVMVCRRLYDRGLIAGQDGNVSARIRDDRILVTPAGVSKMDVGEEDLLELTLDGRLAGKERDGRHASSEVRMHLRIYQRRPDVHAVVHAHPPTAVGFSVVGETLPSNVLPEAVYTLGDVALVPYATPGTAAMADAFDPFIADHDAFLMANHGATTLGSTLTIAHQRMESLEHSARILLAARALGEPRTLSAAQVDELRELRRRAFPGTGPRGNTRPSTTDGERIDE